MTTDVMDKKPKKQRRALKREVRVFIAEIVKAVLDQDGIDHAMETNGWDMDDSDTATCVRNEVYRIARSINPDCR